MFAALPMYDHPGVRAETDSLWAAIGDRLRAAGIDAPGTLSREDDLYAQWRSPDLLLGQTCGLPFRLDLHAQVALVGTIDYGLPDTAPGHYRSFFVARADDPRDSLLEFDGARLAYNESVSQSGWAVACAAPIRFTVGPATGSHRDSARILAGGGAEIAAIDALSWRLLERHTDLTRNLKPVGLSDETPGMAIITAFPEHVEALRTAVAQGIADLDSAARTALGIKGFVQIPRETYLAVSIPPTPEAYAGGFSG